MLILSLCFLVEVPDHLWPEPPVEFPVSTESSLRKALRGKGLWEQNSVYTEGHWSGNEGKRERVPSLSLLKTQRFFLLFTHRWWGGGGRGRFLVGAFSWSFNTSPWKSFYDLSTCKTTSTIPGSFLHLQCSYIASWGTGLASCDEPANAEMQETWVRSLGQEDSLEEEMAIHSSILAWEIHEQRSLAGYSPWGCRRVRHDWARTHAQAKTHLWYLTHLVFSSFLSWPKFQPHF